MHTKHSHIFGLAALSACTFPLFFSLPAHAATAAWSVSELRCEYHTNPLGLDTLNPRLQWVVESTDRAENQTSYRIIVSSSKSLLAKSTGDLWDSTKVDSNETNQIPYSGKPLTTGEICYWKVESWDNRGRSSWSEPALWTMGILNQSDWKAQWIGDDDAYNSPAVQDRNAHKLNIDGIHWLSVPDSVSTTATDMYLRQHFNVSSDRRLSRAVLVVTSDNELTASVNGQSVGHDYRWEPTALLDTTAAVHPGDNVVALNVHNTDFLKAQAVGKIVLIFTSGDDIDIPLDQNAKVADSSATDWQSGTFNDSSWASPATGDAPWGSSTLTDKVRPPVPYLRSTFAVDKPIARATVYVTALGLYDMHINGRRVGQTYFAPGWTDFRKRVHYQTFDVTSLIHPGKNAIGALLGDGWYAGCLAFTGRNNWYGGNPRLLAQLVIAHTDGSIQTVVTDNTWKAAVGPIKQAELLLGDVYDDRDQLTGWDKPGFDDSSWEPVLTGTSAKILVQADPAEPVQIINTLHAVKLTEPKPGLYTFDMGQNMVGWTRIRISGAPGQKITVRHGEMLNPDGTVYLANLRSASGTDVYYLRGGAVETLDPQFTLKGFRYVEVTGLTAKPALDTVTGIVVHSNMHRTGSFTCSNPLINQLYSNIVWGQKGNYISVPTDCPQRDERAGWTGDAEFFAPTAAYNYDVSSFFTSWLVTMCDDSQHDDGSFAHVAPDLEIGSGATAWGDAALQCTYRIYEVYGDKTIVRAHYSEMARYMDFLAAHSDHYVAHVGGFEDWLNLGGGASDTVIDTAYYAYLAGIMSEMADAIGNKADGAKYQTLHDNVQSAFDTNFIQADGSIKDSSQTAYALAFTMNLVPKDQKAAVAAQFVNQLKKFDWHLATGFIGTPRLLPALHEAGEDNAAYRVLMQQTYPGWLFPVKLGATTTWERWDGWTPDKGFQSIQMNSFNHYSFGAVGLYFYTSIAGINSDGPAFRHITIRPEIGGGLTSATGSYDAITGEIVSKWQVSGKALNLTVTIPANTTATVDVPSNGTPVHEGSTLAAKSEGVQYLHQDGQFAEFAVASGTYNFTSELP
jgi:alpha-L-rhamnosidase